MEEKGKTVTEGLQALNEVFVEAETREANRRIELLEKILAGDTTDEIPEGLEDTFSGVVCDEDENSGTLVNLMKEWLEGVVGSPLTELFFGKKLKSADGKTKVVIFAKPVGEMEYFLSTWSEENKKPRYILWPMEMYESQTEAGYIEEEQ